MPEDPEPQSLADWFVKINPISDRLDACTDATCRKAALSDLLTAPRFKLRSGVLSNLGMPRIPDRE